MKKKMKLFNSAVSAVSASGSGVHVWWRVQQTQLAAPLPRLRAMVLQVLPARLR